MQFRNSIEVFFVEPVIVWAFPDLFVEETDDQLYQIDFKNSQKHLSVKQWN